MAEKSMRIKVQELIETGKFTKIELAEELGTKVASISSNMTYLRWGGNFIIWDADKKLSFTDEEGYDAWETDRKANSKSKASESKLSPQELHDKLTKTIATQNKALNRWDKKVDAGPQDDDTILREAEANVVLLVIKIARNQAKLDAIVIPDADTSDAELEGEDEESVLED